MILPVALSNLLGSDTQTFTVLSGPHRKYPMQITYISGIFDDGREIRVKPINLENPECIDRRGEIGDEHGIIGIEKREDGIYLKLHEDRAKVFVHQELSISMQNRDEVTQLGSVKGNFTLKNDKNLIGIFCLFLRLAQITFEKLDQQKKETEAK